MPWSRTSPMQQRTLFIADHLRGGRAHSELCVEYGISRKTGYKWIERYLRHGVQGLEERSRRPRRSPHATAAHVVAAILECRKRHPRWGPKKILKVLHRQHPQWRWPHRSTGAQILRRHGLIAGKKRRRRIGHPGRPHSCIHAVNQVWCADFKGQFRMGNGQYCYPLTVTDAHSRFLLGCEGMLSPSGVLCQRSFTRIFHQYGLPQRIRTDNGAPFAAYTLARLSRLSVWWVRLGVLPELIEPGKPQQNARHERMHRTLKAHTAQPPAGALRAQQSRFDLFRKEFNYERPHEALDMQTPASLYQRSLRCMPSKLPAFDDPAHFEVRRVMISCGIRWKSTWIAVSAACIGEYLGFEEIDDGLWNVYLGTLKLGRFDERLRRIEDVYSRVITPH
jgi:putative transposase